MVSFVQQPIAGGPGCWDSQWQGATCRWRWSWSFEITQNKTKLKTTDFWRSLPKILSSSVFQSMHFVFSSYQNLYYKNRIIRTPNFKFVGISSSRFSQINGKKLIHLIHKYFLQNVCSLHHLEKDWTIYLWKLLISYYAMALTHRA